MYTILLILVMLPTFAKKSTPHVEQERQLPCHLETSIARGEKAEVKRRLLLATTRTTSSSASRAHNSSPRNNLLQKTSDKDEKKGMNFLPLTHLPTIYTHTHIPYNTAFFPFRQSPAIFPLYPLFVPLFGFGVVM